jgi:hypothetical protein
MEFLFSESMGGLCPRISAPPDFRAGIDFLSLCRAM